MVTNSFRQHSPKRMKKHMDHCGCPRLWLPRQRRLHLTTRVPAGVCAATKPIGKAIILTPCHRAAETLEYKWVIKKVRLELVQHRLKQFKAETVIGPDIRV